MSKVSVLISTYNSSRYIDETILSVLNQSWKNYEIIVVDDGSTDDSYDIFCKYKSDNVKVFRQENKGQSAALNKAIFESTGEYIKFLDADDIMSPMHLELQINRIKGNDDFIASCEWGRFYDNNYLSAKFIPEMVWKDLEPLEWIKLALTQKSDMMGAWIWLIPRQLLNKAGYWNEKLSLNNDFDFSIRLLLAAKGVKFAKGAKLYYRSGLSNSLSQNFSQSGVESAFLATKLGCDNILSIDNNEKTRILCANRYMTWVFRIYPKFPGILTKFEVEIERLGKSNIKMDGGNVFIFLRNIIGWKKTKRIQLLFYKIGWKMILKLKQKAKVKKHA